ncbi:UNVERIFIED_CONTAM: sugar-specific transcriptional regulator TrmB [Paenibacillus sp. PvR008]
MTQPNRLSQDMDRTPGSIGGTEHMERLLHHLRNLGFTEMEAKVMVELSRQNAASGYEVAKRLGASRSNVYAALQRLAGQGYLRASAGEPVRYSMLPPGELTRMIEGQLQESLRAVEKEMPRAEPAKPTFYNAEGDRNVLESLTRELERAEHEIVLDLWREEAELLRTELEKAEKRGVRLLWSCDNGESVLGPWLPRASQEAGQEPAGRKFSFVIDRRWCMLGMRGENCSTQALITEHPVMTGMLLNHFAQDLILYELEHDMGSELSTRYGWRYEGIIGKYMSAGE